jgi:hypothetical protein
MIKGWKKLTKAERRHLHEIGCNSISSFQMTIDFQFAHDESSGLTSCFECRAIARKLGLAPKLEKQGGKMMKKPGYFIEEEMEFFYKTPKRCWAALAKDLMLGLIGEDVHNLDPEHWVKEMKARLKVLKHYELD